MSRKLTILLVVGCLLLSGMVNSAYAGQIQSNELSPSEALSFSQAQDSSIQAIETAVGGDITGALAIIGLVAIAVIIIAVT